MRNLLQDVRFGLRVLSNSPGFSVVAVLTLGLGIACTTTVFSWIDAVLLHPFPGTSNSDQLALLEMITTGAPNGGNSVSWLDYRDYRDRMKNVAVRRHCAFTLGDQQRARLVWGELASGNYFEVMGVRPQVGRLFTHEEAGDALGAYPVVVISSRLWRDYFRADPAIAGKTVRINRRTLTIAGVAPPEFRGASPVVQYDLWIPATMGVALGLAPEASFKERGFRGMWEGVYRRPSGKSIQQARSEAMAIAASLTAANPKTNRGVGATVLPPWEAHNGVNEYLRAPLQILLAVSFVVLLIVCANVANLLLARSVARQREFGIRFAVGAGRVRVALQVMTETLILAAGGAGVAILMLLWMQGSLVAMVPRIGYTISVAAAINPRIVVYTALACLLTALISGASPALFVFRSNLNEVLKEGSRSDTAGAASRRTRSLLVVGEVALATVALVGAGLFVRSFQNIRGIHPGFNPDPVLFGRFFIESTGYTAAQVQQFALRLQERLHTVAGMEDVSFTDFVPLSTTAGPWNFVKPEGYTPQSDESMAVNRALVSTGYFSSMQIPLLEGRDFNQLDDGQAAAAMIVNQAFASRYFRGQNPVGHKVRAAGKDCIIVGLVRDGKYFTPAEAPRPFFYLHFPQFYQGSQEIYFLVKTVGPPEQAIPLLRRAVVETDPNALGFHAISLSEYTEVATFGQKAAANLMGALGLLCLLLAALGLYSVMSCSVSQRIPEIGVRMAMGARPANVIAMIVSEGMRLALAGIVLGAAAAFAVTRLVASLLVGVGSADPATFLMAAIFLAFVTVVATWLPAFRATRIDPLLALRK